MAVCKECKGDKNYRYKGQKCPRCDGSGKEPENKGK